METVRRGHNESAFKALKSERDGGGEVPGIWAAILNALDLQLIAEERPGEGKK